MNQTAIVDFSQVEEALRNSSRERQVLTAREQTKNTARLIKYGAAGLALVIVSIGIAFWLATQWPHYQAGRKAVTVETAERPILVPAPGSAPTVIQVPENKIMTDVSVFRTIARVDLGLPTLTCTISLRGTGIRQAMPLHGSGRGAMQISEKTASTTKSI